MTKAAMLVMIIGAGYGLYKALSPLVQRVVREVCPCRDCVTWREGQ